MSMAFVSSFGAKALEFLLIAAVTMTLQALLCWLQRRRAVERDGWHYLTPGPMTWFGLVLSFALTGFMTYIYLFVGSSRDDAEFQMAVLLVLATVFNIATVLLAYSTIVEQVRWNDVRVERRTLLFETRAMTWHQLASLGSEPGGYWWISAYDGPRIRFSPYCNGFRDLLAKITEHLPPDLPPAEAEMIQHMAEENLVSVRATPGSSQRSSPRG